MDNELCRSIIEGEEGKIVREESCINKSKNTCCYLCPHQEACRISCTYLVKSEDVSEFKKYVDQEIKKYTEKIENLSVLFAEGKIGEASYINSVSALEKKVNKLRESKKKPLISPKYFDFEDFEEAKIEKPTSLWYLVPFFFAILGGIVAYVGTRDRDKKMAETLLIFGIVWSILLSILVWIEIYSLMTMAGS